MAKNSQVSPFKPDVLASRVALITGGGSGIGLEIARQLGLHGARVVITGRREQVLQEACRALGAEGVEARYVQGDVRAPADCDNMVAQAAQWAGRLDVLVNCAAGNFLAPAEALSSGGFRTVMEIDAVGTFNMCRAAFPQLRRARGASIVNISATLHYGATWYQTHASAAKAAVDSMTRSMALEWGAYGIRVNGVAPGPIQGTAGMAKLAPTAAEQMEEMVAAHIPLGRMGAKWDIAMACLYLCSSAGGFVTGHTLVVDGAEWMYREPIVPREVVTKLSRGVEAHSRGVGLAGGDGWRSRM